MTQEEFAVEFGMKGHSHVSNIESGRDSAGSILIKAICKEYYIDERWFTDETDQQGLSKDKKSFISVVKNVEAENGHGPNHDSETYELLEMTKEVVESETHWADSLKSNIRSFHSGFQSDMKKKHRTSVAIRKSDPFEQKENILKERQIM